MLDNYDPTLGEIPNGQIIAGRYEIIQFLGSGAMGSVHLVRDQLLSGNIVAIKILRHEMARDQNVRRRFLQEVKLMNRVNHANVVRTFDIGEVDNLIYFTMEYLDGYTLEDVLSEDGIPYDQIEDIIIQVCQGLEAIHDANIIHRDLKPANIIVVNDLIKITDFGVAKSADSQLTRHKEIVGSTAYIAPEVWQGMKPNRTVDFYGLGIILYELVTGRVPFDSDNPASIMWKHVKEPPVPPSNSYPDIPPWLDALILSLLSKDPKQRPQKSREILDIVRNKVVTTHTFGETPSEQQKESERDSIDPKDGIIFSNLPTAEEANNPRDTLSPSKSEDSEVEQDDEEETRDERKARQDRKAREAKRKDDFASQILPIVVGGLIFVTTLLVGVFFFIRNANNANNKFFPFKNTQSSQVGGMSLSKLDPKIDSFPMSSPKGSSRTRPQTRVPNFVKPVSRPSFESNTLFGPYKLAKQQKVTSQDANDISQLSSEQLDVLLARWNDLSSILFSRVDEPSDSNIEIQSDQSSADYVFDMNTFLKKNEFAQEIIDARDRQQLSFDSYESLNNKLTFFQRNVMLKRENLYKQLNKVRIDLLIYSQHSKESIKDEIENRDNKIFEIEIALEDIGEHIGKHKAKLAAIHDILLELEREDLYFGAGATWKYRKN